MLLTIPGVNEHAHGFRGIAEALYLRDHMTRQTELADLTDDAAERAARITFVVVGAGYTGTEVAAQGVLYTDGLPRTAGVHHHAASRSQALMAAARGISSRPAIDQAPPVQTGPDRLRQPRGVSDQGPNQGTTRARRISDSDTLLPRPIDRRRSR
jgi:NADH dehydrogenase